MVKRIMMSLVLSTLLNVGHSFAMENSNPNPEPQKQEARELTPTEKENAHKMMLMKQYFEDMAKEEVKEEERLPEVPQDVQNAIGATLHDVSANPVLNGELVYTMDNGEKKQFKIIDLVKKDGSIDLSNKEVFGDASKYLLITTDPEKFFSIDKNSDRLVILIAPKFLIGEKIRSSSNSFQLMMAYWNVDEAPIGIFWRMEKWEKKGWYDCLTTSNLVSISKNNLHENWVVSHRSDRFNLSQTIVETSEKISFLFK